MAICTTGFGGLLGLFSLVMLLLLEGEVVNMVRRSGDHGEIWKLDLMHAYPDLARIDL